MFFNDTFHGFIRECPYVGVFKIENATFNANSEAMKDFHRVQFFPNGQYKLWIKIFNKRDENISNYTIFVDIYYRSNVLNFNEDI